MIQLGERVRGCLGAAGVSFVAILFGATAVLGQAASASRAAEAFRVAKGAATVDRPGAYRDLRALVDGPLLLELDDQQQHEALFLAAEVAIILRRFADAHALLRRSSEHEHSVALDWVSRFTTATQVDEYADAVFVLRELSARWPETFTSLRPRLVYDGLQSMRRGGRADLAIEASEVLFAGRWLDAAGQEPSSVWRDLALARIERSDLAGAMEVASRITSPAALIEMRSDKRFDALIAAMPSRFDINRAVEEEIESLRRAVQAAPNVLHPLVRLASALRVAGRLEEALMLVDDTLERAASVNRVSPFTDGRDQVPWLRDTRSDILWTMGRHADAADELKKASDVMGNVSQRINYAGRLVRLGRGAEALPLLRDLSATPYGFMQAAAVEVAAAVQVGDRRAWNRAFKYLQSHETDSLAALQRGLVSMGDLDGAARVLIKRLQSPETRGEVLLYVQDYLETPDTPYEAQQDSPGLLSRPDVRAVLEEVGRVESYPIYEP